MAINGSLVTAETSAAMLSGCASFFQPSVLSPTAVATAREAFDHSSPYRHLHLREFFAHTNLEKVAEELGNLSFTFKETDLFKLYQTGDLANIDPERSEHREALQHTLALRQALYTPQFRRFVEAVTGCAPLTQKTDCSCNIYHQGCHLLCHDDVIGTRAVSFVIYLTPHRGGWRPEHGGALELYEAPGSTVQRDTSGSASQDMSVPRGCLPPEWASLCLFSVVPGVSYHSVQEVLSPDEPRVSISGWFHAAAPPAGAELVSSLASLQGPPAAATLHTAPCAAPRAALVPAAERQLAEVVNPVYLNRSSISAVHAQLAAHGAALLGEFLQPRVAAALLRATRVADAKDGLGKGLLPSYSAGLDRRGWRAAGPIQVQRYALHTARRRKRDGAKEAGAGGVGEQLQAVREILHSAPFRQLLGELCSRRVEHLQSEARRFRPGLDYTLAHVGTLREAETLDATLCFVDARGRFSDVWASGDAGGFECYVRKDSESGAAAAEVYRADEDTDGVTSIHALPNSLSLSFRPPDTMKFIKYVSASAPGSRWDVAVEATLA